MPDGPTGDQTPVAGSIIAMLVAATLPITVNDPAATSIVGNGPGPSGSQLIAATTSPSAPGTPKPGNQVVVHWPVRSVARGIAAAIAANAESIVLRIELPDSRVEGLGNILDREILRVNPQPAQHNGQRT